MRLYPQIILLLMLVLATACKREQSAPVFEPWTWQVSGPEAAGMDRDIIDSAFLAASDAGSVDALLVIRYGKIVAEQYFNGYSADHPHNVMSVSKSMLSAIAGIAIYGEYGLDLEDSMLEYFPEYQHGGLDPRKYDISIEHLLTMRMGIERESEDNYGVYMNLYNSDNWIQAAIEHPLVYDPGTKMRYNTFITHLLSGVISKATGMSTKTFADKHLFSPMGIDIDSWEQDPQGIYFGGNAMHLTPRELGVFGLLYLHEGMLNSEQLIPREWIERTLSPSTNASHPNSWGEWKNYNYAWLWWLGEFSEADSFMGYGYGGQFVIVFPDLDLIVVATSDNNVPPEATNDQEWAVFEIVSRYIVPSAQ